MTRIGRRIATAIVAALALSLALVAAVRTADAGDAVDPKKIMERVRDRPVGGDRQAVMTMTLVSADGFRRERRIEYREKDYAKERKTLVYIRDPSDLRGTAVLIYSYGEQDGKEDDIWLYLPSMRKTKRIAAKNKQGRFIGSEFSFADMERLHVGDYEYSFLGRETVDSRPAYKISATAATGAATLERTGYSKRLVWVDVERNLILKDIYFDARGAELKLFVAEKVEQVKGYWTVTKGRMENLQTGDRTSLDVVTINYDTNIDDAIFRQHALTRGVD